MLCNCVIIILLLFSLCACSLEQSMGLCSCSAPCSSQLQQDMCVLGKSYCVVCSRQACPQCAHNTNSHVCIMLLCIHACRHAVPFSRLLCSRRSLHIPWTQLSRKHCSSARDGTPVQPLHIARAGYGHAGADLWGNNLRQGTQQFCCIIFEPYRPCRLQNMCRKIRGCCRHQ